METKILTVAKKKTWMMHNLLFIVMELFIGQTPILLEYLEDLWHLLVLGQASPEKNQALLSMKQRKS